MFNYRNTVTFEVFVSPLHTQCIEFGNLNTRSQSFKQTQNNLILDSLEFANLTNKKLTFGKNSQIKKKKLKEKFLKSHKTDSNEN